MSFSDRELVEVQETLSKYALRLTRDEGAVEDLVQETLLSMLRFRDKFEEGTNLKAWGCTVLRNRFFAECRKKRTAVRYGMLSGNFENAANQIPIPETQLDTVFLREVFEIIDKEISPEMQTTLIAVSCFGDSYEQVAKDRGVETGTVKPRVHRGRELLKAKLGESP